MLAVLYVAQLTAGTEEYWQAGPRASRRAAVVAHGRSLEAGQNAQN